MGAGASRLYLRASDSYNPLGRAGPLFSSSGAALLYAPIHPSAWKGGSKKFAPSTVRGVPGDLAEAPPDVFGVLPGDAQLPLLDALVRVGPVPKLPERLTSTLFHTARRPTINSQAVAASLPSLIQSLGRRWRAKIWKGEDSTEEKK
jgi:hypothetical protein